MQQDSQAGSAAGHANWVAISIFTSSFLYCVNMVGMHAAYSYRHCFSTQGASQQCFLYAAKCFAMSFMRSKMFYSVVHVQQSVLQCFSCAAKCFAMFFMCSEVFCNVFHAQQSVLHCFSCAAKCFAMIFTRSKMFYSVFHVQQSVLQCFSCAAKCFAVFFGGAGGATCPL
jgi:hypothetical protein